MAVIWITGLSGAGKTTLATWLQNKLYMELSVYPILLDGDRVREALEDEQSYAFDDRKRLSYKYAKLAKMLSEQDQIVIVATVSMFEAVRQWNRANNANYLEIYLKVPKEIRMARDPKKLYKNGLDVVEFADGFEEPKNPDLLINGHKPYDKEFIFDAVKKCIYLNKEKKFETW